MQKSIRIFLMVCFMVSLASVASAATISFGDSTIYWPGWPSTDSSENTTDVLVNPWFTGGSVEVTGGLLTSLTVDSASVDSIYWPILAPGDLFIDLGANQTWDYVVDLSSWSIAGYNNPVAGADDYNLTPVSLSLGNSETGYILSGVDNTGSYSPAWGWPNLYIRDLHPVAADIDWEDDITDAVYFSGWDEDDYSIAQYSFDFTSLSGGGLDLGTAGEFTIGWTTNCANDVLLETLEYPTIPEPATLSLLGLGLLGLFGFKRKRS
ncbi:PEP-CTERM sorting domain-containing protein [Candidatus Omnitrophota bacterium]